MLEFRDPVFALGRAGALATAIAAALATFELSLPDRSPRWLALPMPFAALWLGTMGYGCIADWLEVGPAGLQLGHSAGCFKTILLTSLPLAAVLFVMVRHAGTVRPIATALAGGLALSAVAEGGMTLYHDVDATLMDVLIHLAAVAVVIGLSTAGARTVFRLLGPRSPLPTTAAGSG
ncbi:MAG: NrsF family protein [Pseudomonadota bacterium]